MIARVVSFQATPNPNALKCVLDRSLGDRPRSYFNEAEAAGDSLGEALFAIGGVTNVLISGDWLTVSKRPGAAWGPIRAEVTRVLEGS